MKISIFAVLCVLPIGSAVCQDYSLWYDVNNACENRWCKNQPNGCCVGDDVIANLNESISAFVKKDGYTLRGWTNSKVNDINTNTDELSNLIITKDGSVQQIDGAISLYPAWAKNCKSSITGGTCNLTIGDNGSVTYMTRANNGYECDSECDTSDPTFNPNDPDNIPADWITFTLDDDGGSGGVPTKFACQKNQGVTDCPRGCYKSNDDCSAGNKFTGLSQIPKKTNFAYDGHFAGNNQILNNSGELNSTNWANVSSTNVDIIAHWTENKILIDYVLENCQSLPSGNPSVCDVNNAFVLSDATPSNNQKFDGWLVNGNVISNSSIICGRATFGGNVGDVVAITAVCSDVHAGPKSYNLTGVVSNLDSEGVVTDTPVDEGSIGLNLNGGSLTSTDMGAVYSVGDTIDLTPMMSDAEFCAWCPTSETVAKGASGGTRSRGASSVPEGCSTSIDVSDLSGGTSYYAVYTPSDNNKYIINYVNNGVLDQYTTVCEEGETVYTPVYYLQASNHLFLGWNVNNTRYEHSAEIVCNEETLGVAPGNTVIIRAEWSPYLEYAPRSVQLVAACKDTDVPCSYANPRVLYCQLNPSVDIYGCYYSISDYTESNRITKLNNLPQADGKIFDGYYYNDEMVIDAEGNLVYDWQNFPSGTTTRVELTPHWHDNPEGALYTVTYDCGDATLRDGKVLPTDTSVAYDQPFKPISAQEYCYKKGYIEEGWRASSLDVDDGWDWTWPSDTWYNWRYLENKRFVAEWKPEYFYITYDCGKGVDITGKIEQFNESHKNNHVELEDKAYYDVSFKPLSGNLCQLDGFEFDKWEVWDGYAKKYGKKFEGGVYQIWDYERDMPYGGWYGTIKLVATYKKSGEAENWVHYTVDDNGATIHNQVVVPSDYGAHEQLTEFWCQTNNNLFGYCSGCYLEEHCNSDEFSELSRKPSKGNSNYFAGYYYGDTQVINQNGYVTNQFTSGGPYEIVARWLQDFNVSYECGDGNIVYSDTAHWGKTYSFNTNACPKPDKYSVISSWTDGNFFIHGDSTTWNTPYDVTIRPAWYDTRDWNGISLGDSGSTFAGINMITWSLPNKIYCPWNQTEYPECRGCFTDKVCDEEHRFTGLTRIPTQLSGTYNGHVYYNHSDEDYSDIEYVQILDEQGQLIDPEIWQNKVDTGYLAYIPADWICADGYERVQYSDYMECKATSAITSEDKIQILYKIKLAYIDHLGRIKYSNTGYTGDVSFMVCNVGEKLNLPDVSDIAIDGYTFDHWEKDSDTYTPGQQLDCNRETLGGVIGEPVTFTGYYNMSE